MRTGMTIPLSLRIMNVINNAKRENIERYKIMGSDLLKSEKLKKFERR